MPRPVEEPAEMRFPRPRFKLLTLILLIALSSLPMAVYAPKAGEAVRDDLRVRYPEKRAMTEGQFHFAEGTEVLALNLPALRESLPDARFFRTGLPTGYRECLTVDVAIMVRRVEDRASTLECVSPQFREPPKDFLDQFRGVHATETAPRQRIGRDIGEIFKEISGGQLRRGRLHGDQFTIELWVGDRHDRNVVVAFDSNNILTSILLDYPRVTNKP